ncbi:hypothetical protein [Pontibacter liquoris]|uniref:hypothetical protein n=1 Tax=Pontibacter liquoris TaxID=2905677 RepID=UPI001FA6B32B|nr:hypothetical protein [Pontibacter liquoris]
MKATTLRRLIIAVFMVWSGLTWGYSRAQNRSAIDIQVWPSGEVVLTSGDTVSGPLMFYRNQDVINVQHKDGTVSAFSPVNVQYFIANELPGGNHHVFRTYAWDQGHNYSNFRKPTFFEQLNDGYITLIMRETYTARDLANTGGYRYYNSAYYAPSNSEWAEQVTELYYALLPDGTIITLRNVRKDLGKLFGKKSSLVKSFVKQNKLSYENPMEVVAIVNYFNSLE